MKARLRGNQRWYTVEFRLDITNWTHPDGTNFKRTDLMILIKSPKQTEKTAIYELQEKTMNMAEILITKYDFQDNNGSLIDSISILTNIFENEYYHLKTEKKQIELY